MNLLSKTYFLYEPSYSTFTLKSPNFRYHAWPPDNKSMAASEDKGTEQQINGIIVTLFIQPK